MDSARRRLKEGMQDFIRALADAGYTTTPEKLVEVLTEEQLVVGQCNDCEAKVPVALCFKCFIKKIM
jgi:hypothetical protein